MQARPGHAAEQPLRLGAAGLGRAFVLMLPTFVAHPRVQLVAAADPRDEARRQFVTEFSGRAVEETFFRMPRNREFDVAELSLSSYTVSMFREPRPFVAIPV